MTDPKMFALAQRWRDLMSQQKDLDFKKAVWSRDARDEFPLGTVGETKFLNWLSVDLGMKPSETSEILLRAEAARVVPDERTWKRVGGFKQVRALAPLTTRQRTEVLESSKTTGFTLVRTARDKGLPITGTAARKPARVVKTAVQTDAEILAGYIARTCKNTPRHIDKIVQRYLVGETTLRAVA